MSASTLEGTVAPERQQGESGRFYTFPGLNGGPEEAYWSVTTALQAYAKDGLKWWAAQLSSRRAMANLPMLIASQLLEPCGRTYARTEPRRCEKCPDCVQRWLELFHLGESTRRKHEGSALHDVFEYWIQHGDFPADTVEAIAVWAANQRPEYLNEHPDLAKMLPEYIVKLQKWIKDYAVEPGDFLASEMTVFNDAYKYGGTLDTIWRIVPRNRMAAKLVVRVLGRTPSAPDDHAQVVVDLKTREGEDKQLYDEHAMQLAAYRAARWCMPSKVDRLLRPMLPTNGAVVLQVRPDGYTCEPVRAGDKELKAFLGVLEAFRWKVDHGSSSIAVKTFPVPADFDGWYATLGAPGGEKPPPRKRAARKAPGRQAQTPPSDSRPAPGPVSADTPADARPAPGSGTVPPRIASADPFALITGNANGGPHDSDEPIPF